MLWLGLHFPVLPLEALTIGRTPDRAADAPLPQVVTEHNRVMLRNTAAAGAGIGLGSTLATAHSIAPELAHHVRDPAREAQRLVLLAEALYRFSSHVSLAPPAGLALEIGGSLKLFGDVAVLARQARDLCLELGHRVRCRWAHTPLAALTLARAGTTTMTGLPLRRAAVEPEPLTAARLERLANMGIHTLDQLLALPSRDLAQRFGKELADYLQRLTGDRPDPRPCVRPSECFHDTLHLLEPLNSKEALALPMQRLLTDLEHWLIGRQLGAGQLRWHFGPSGGAARRLCMPVSFAGALQRREAFLEITRLKLAQTELPEDVISLTLEARRLARWTAPNRDLFRHLPGQPVLHGAPREPNSDLNRLVDQLRARLGGSACHGLAVRDQHVPEQAWGRAAPSSSAAEPPVPTRKRPLWLFEPPRPTERERLTLLKGPERIHTGWWLRDHGARDWRGLCRDYYVARHHNGAECWAFVDGHDRWYLHGYFS